MDINSIFTQLKNAIRSGAGVEFSFGAPTKIGDTSIVPVARISFAFGGGGGSNSVKAKKKEKAAAAQEQTETPEGVAPDTKGSDFGGGGGGSLKTDPVGLFTITGDKVRFHPVVSVKEILTAFGIISLLVIRIARLRSFRRR